MFKSGDKVFCCKQGNRAVYGNYYWVGKESGATITCHPGFLLCKINVKHYYETIISVLKPVLP
jgi:hypothetical protein